MRKFTKTIAAAAILTAGLTMTAHADQHAGAMKSHAASALGWLDNPTVISAIKAQNVANAGLSQGDIDKLDKQWRAEVGAGGGPLINKLMATKLSAYLKKVKDDSQGLYTEIFVMDNKGLNVGQSDVTSDYWQGDEGKWQKTFKVGAGAVDVGDVEEDESTQQIQAQLSVSIADGGNVIGAVTIGMDMDALGE